MSRYGGRYGAKIKKRKARNKLIKKVMTKALKEESVKKRLADIMRKPLMVDHDYSRIATRGI